MELKDLQKGDVIAILDCSTYNERKIIENFPETEMLKLQDEDGDPMIASYPAVTNASWKFLKKYKPFFKDLIKKFNK